MFLNLPSWQASPIELTSEREGSFLRRGRREHLFANGWPRSDDLETFTARERERGMWGEERK